MIRYTSQYQTKIEDFCQLYQLNLNKDNRWIQLGSILPWDKMVSVYGKKLSMNMGARTIDPRVVIGAFIVKHKLNISDQETIETIRENPYIQFFLGLDSLHTDPLFSPSLFVEIRKRLGKESFDSFTTMIIEQGASINKKEDNKQVGNQGKLKIDATVADQYIRYPNDLGILNETRVNTEKQVDLLFAMSSMRVKPRTYRRLAHRRYVSMTKKKKKQKSKLRMEIRYQLQCVERNLRHIDKLLDALGPSIPFGSVELKKLYVAHEVVRQQRHMYDHKVNRIDDRIVSVSQPHVRPIVRGKQGKDVEFGSKLGLSLFNGFTANQTLSWDAYHESVDLINQAESYKMILGYYPELIQADKLYWTNQNRNWCKERGIRMTATPKGRPVTKTAAQKRKLRKEYAERNHIEGKIGNAKQVLSLNQIKAKLKSTSEAWVGAILFVMNLSVLAKNHGFTF
jgi:hypothetical protein